MFFSIKSFLACCDIMIVVTTPMCKEIVEWAGLSEFKVNKHPDEEDGDLAILLSESKTEMDSLAIKTNTFSQIAQSIIAVSNTLYENGLIDERVSYEKVNLIFEEFDSDFINSWFEDMDTIREHNSNKSVKVYSEFLKDIVNDIGAQIADSNAGSGYDYVVYPDYLADKVESNEDFNDDSLTFIEMPTHGKVSKSPLERAQQRYSILINALE